jgi:hypothetical protein
VKEINELPTAFFVRDPFTLEDLTRPHFLHQRKGLKVEARVELSAIEYKNFVTDLCADRPFIEKHKDVSRVDYDGVWHCLLVRQKGKRDGVLVMSEGHDYPKWAAYIESETSLQNSKSKELSGESVMPPS